MKKLAIPGLVLAASVAFAPLAFADVAPVDPQVVGVQTQVVDPTTDPTTTTTTMPTTAPPTTAPTTAPTTSPTTAPPTTIPAGDDKDCIDFPTQAAAQAVLDADKTDPNRLDGNHNGIACEGPADSDPSLPTIIPVPVLETSSPQMDVIPSAIDTGRA